jgi:hypothetical protein
MDEGRWKSIVFDIGNNRVNVVNGVSRKTFALLF